MAIVLHQPDVFLGDTQAEQPELAHRAVERLGLPPRIPLVDHFLQGHLGLQWRLIGAGASLHGRVNCPVQLLPAPGRARWPR